MRRGRLGAMASTRHAFQWPSPYRRKLIVNSGELFKGGFDAKSLRLPAPRHSKKHSISIN